MLLNGKNPLVSVVIPSYRSRNSLEQVLLSLKSQTYDNIEVIAVDRPSADGTKDLVEKMGYTYVPLDSERTKAVNTGAKASNGEIIYYIGSDYVIEPDVIQKAVEVLIEKNADAVVIPNRVRPTGFWSQVRWLEKETYLGDDTIEAARFFKKDAFLAVGGYDEDMVAYEEHDLHNRFLEKGFRIVRMNGASELNIGEPNSLSEYFWKNYYYGETISKYMERHPEMSIRQLLPLRTSHVRGMKKFTSHPKLALGFLLFQTTRYIAAGLGYVVSRSRDR